MQSDIKGFTAGAYCGGVALRYTVKDSLNNVITPTWLSFNSATFVFTVNSNNVAHAGRYHVSLEQYLIGFPNITDTNGFYIDLTTNSACSVTSIDFANARSPFVMYTDNGSLTVSFPTWSQTPACGYTATLALTGLASPFVPTNNGNGTWTLA
jgi:hypothetical protein